MASKISLSEIERQIKGDIIHYSSFDPSIFFIEGVEGIAVLQDELKPEVMRVVFKDSGFAIGVVKTNAV